MYSALLVIDVDYLEHKNPSLFQGRSTKGNKQTSPSTLPDSARGSTFYDFTAIPLWQGHRVRTPSPRTGAPRTPDVVERRRLVY